MIHVHRLRVSLLVYNLSPASVQRAALIPYVSPESATCVQRVALTHRLRVSLLVYNWSP
jgi:hypothetical protein